MKFSITSVAASLLIVMSVGVVMAQDDLAEVSEGMIVSDDVTVSEDITTIEFEMAVGHEGHTYPVTEAPSGYVFATLREVSAELPTELPEAPLPLADDDLVEETLIGDHEHDHDDAYEDYCGETDLDATCCPTDGPWTIPQLWFLDCRGITMGGFMQAGITGTANKPADKFNGVVATNDRNAELQMNQLFFYLDRPTDTRAASGRAVRHCCAAGS